MLPDQNEQNETTPLAEDEESSPEKANLLNRFLAKLIDLLVVAAIYEIPLHVSFLVGLVYLSLADGFRGGSVGKRMIGLTVKLRENQLQETSFRESILRNAPLAAAYLLYAIPFIGWLIALSIVGFESFLILGHPQGIRFGDELAHTRVSDKEEQRRGISSSESLQEVSGKQ